MTTGTQPQFVPIIHQRLSVIMEYCYLSEVKKAINRGHYCGIRQDLRQVFTYCQQKLFIQLLFDGLYSVFSTQYFSSYSFNSGVIYRSALVRVCLRIQVSGTWILIAVGYFQVIPEHIIEADLQTADASLCCFPLLNAHQIFFPLCPISRNLIQLSRNALALMTLPLCNCTRSFFFQGIFHAPANIGTGMQPAGQLSDRFCSRRLPAGQVPAVPLHPENVSVAPLPGIDLSHTQLAWPFSPDRCNVSAAAMPCREVSFPDQFFHQIQAVFDPAQIFRGIRIQRLSKPGAHGGDGMVQYIKKTAAAFHGWDAGVPGCER